MRHSQSGQPDKNRRERAHRYAEGQPRKRSQSYLLLAALMMCGAAVPVISQLPQQALAVDKKEAKECKEPAAEVQEGEASWYGHSKEGKRTANGERFDPNASTAAHPTLPLGTEIDVTNLENGRETTLTVNDRGPYAKDRVLDVSKKGAKDLGFVKDGTAPVRIEPKDVPEKC